MAAAAAGSEATTTLRLDSATEAAGGLRLSPDVLLLAAGDAGALTVRNIGADAVPWTAAATGSWLALDRSEGVVAAGALTRVGVSASPTAQPGTTATVTITYEGGAVTSDVEVGAAAPGSTAPEVTGPEPAGSDTDTVTPDGGPSAPPGRDQVAPSEPPPGGADGAPTRDPQPPADDPADEDPPDDQDGRDPPPDPDPPEPDPLRRAPAPVDREPGSG
jgi:hypothetical protein